MENQYSLQVKTTVYDSVNCLSLISILSKIYDGKADSNLIDKILTDIEKDYNPILYVGNEETCIVGGNLLTEIGINYEIEKL